MKVCRDWLTLVVWSAVVSTSLSQSSRVSTEYVKDTKRTKVESSLLYVMNTPEQFIELQLQGFYKGQTLVKPERIGISVFSLAKKAQFRASSDQELFVITDGQRWKLGTVTRVGLNGQTKSGTDTFFSENRPELGMQVPFPASAMVRNAGGDVNGLLLEWLETTIKPEQLSKLAGAVKIQFQLGKSAFEFNETQMQILREFAGKLLPQPVNPIQD